MSSPIFLAGMPSDYVPVTPNDSTDNLPVGKSIVGLYIQTGGDIEVDTKGGTRIITVGDFSQLVLVNPVRVRALNTTASGIHAVVV